LPVYIHPATLVIDKRAINKKYNGGLNQFRDDYFMPKSERMQEDDELIAINALNPEDFDLEKLVENGLSFDEENQYSNDFAIVLRYSSEYWKVDWLTENSVFAWHINSDQRCIHRAKEISEMSTETIAEKMEEGENLFFAIKMNDLKTK
jgi:hypothetical protein